MDRKFYLVLIIISLFFIPISPTLFDSNIQISDIGINHSQGRDDGSSSSINITEIGPFESLIETWNAENGTKYPVVYLKEPFHFEGNLSHSNGQSLGEKCLNIYLDPEENIRPIETIQSTNNNGSFQWFSGDPSQNPALRGIETTGGKLEGFRTLRIAFEPDSNVPGGCDSDNSSDGSYLDIDILVRSRVNIQVLQSWSFVDENGVLEGDLVVGEVALLRDRLDLAIENEKVSFLRQYYSYSEEWVTELVINSTTNEQGRAGFEWEFGGRTCEGQPCPGLWRIIAHYPGSMFFAPSQDNISHELQYKQTVTSDSNVGEAGSEDENWNTAMNIVEISALIVSLISLLLYLVLRNRETESDLDELADKIVSKQNSIEKTKHKIENTDMETSETTQNHEQTPKLEAHDSDSKQDLENPEKNVTIVQNITYNIRDSSIVGDLNTGKNSDLE
jgi:hypothetical protein